MKQLLTLLFIGIASLYAQTVPSYVPTNGLVGWWPFNGNANDESGNGNNGSYVTGVNPTSDRNGASNSAMGFSGQGSITLSNLPTTGSQDFTIAGWLSTSNASTARKGIACWGQDIPWQGTYFFVNPNGKLAFDFAYNAGPRSTASVNDAQWHFISVTNSNGFIQLYVDGVPNGQGKQMSLPNITGNTKSIGTNTPNIIASGYDFAGKLDDIAIWDRALTQQEILALYFGCNDSLQLQPQNFTAYTGTGWANFKCRSTDTATSYQWQQNIVSGWTNLSNFGNYTGSTSDSLVITGVTSAMNNYGYRCIVTGCTTDTSDAAVLTVVNGIGLGESTLQKLTVSPNPTNGIVSLNTSVVGTYELLTLDGRVLETGTAKKDYDLTKYPKGVYHLRLSTDEGTRVLKVVKN